MLRDGRELRKRAFMMDCTRELTIAQSSITGVMQMEHVVNPQRAHLRSTA
jgi:hypothetical protein